MIESLIYLSMIVVGPFFPLRLLAAVTAGLWFGVLVRWEGKIRRQRLEQHRRNCRSQKPKTP